MHNGDDIIYQVFINGGLIPHSVCDEYFSVEKYPATGNLEFVRVSSKCVDEVRRRWGPPRRTDEIRIQVFEFKQGVLQNHWYNLTPMPHHEAEKKMLDKRFSVEDSVLFH